MRPTHTRHIHTCFSWFTHVFFLVSFFICYIILFSSSFSPSTGNVSFLPFPPFSLSCLSLVCLSAFSRLSSCLCVEALLNHSYQFVRLSTHLFLSPFLFTHSLSFCSPSLLSVSDSELCIWVCGGVVHVWEKRKVKKKIENQSIWFTG